MYEVYITQGQGFVFAFYAATLDECLEHIRLYKSEGSWAIKCPNGTWHEW